MLSRTVNHGKSAASWNTTLRLGSGRLTGSPRKSTSPRVGPSKPATMLRRVDLPQPDGPRTAANSLGATSRSIASSATSRPVRPLNYLLTPRRATTGPVVSGMPFEDPPPEQHAGETHDDLVGEEAQEPDGEHGRHADVHPPHVVRVPENVSEAGLDGDHLGHEDGRPGYPDAQP